VPDDELQATITRDNALALLATMACPYCGGVGRFQLFDEIANNGVGIQCLACEKHHPFIKQRVMWLRGEKVRRSNDIVAVIKECGAFCYICGITFDDLMAKGIAASVHHTRPFAEHGEQFKKIPVCSVCHELANFMQRTHRRWFDRKS
jgi:hypothetical protein